MTQMEFQYTQAQVIRMNQRINTLTEELVEVKKELAEVKRERDSYALWMDRSIARLKEMQNA